MTDNWRRDRLPGIVEQLASRPGHEATRVAVTRLIVDGLAGDVGAVTHEYRMPVVRGRADALFGATVFEFKKDLRHEMADVLAKLPDYLAEYERQTGRRPALGIATDGAHFHAFELRDGKLTKLSEFKTDVRRPEALLGWLAPAVSDLEDLNPEPFLVARELGRDSLTFRRADEVLVRLWAVLGNHPEVRLKRDLWDRLLREVYGEEVGSDRLFLQHTYLTILAKTIAAKVLDLPIDDPAKILSGAALAEIGIQGAVESDFFDWLLLHPEGPVLVGQLARQAARFRLHDVKQDVLKALYESLMDPAQRHDLGEYYTPDWLAAKVTAQGVPRPLEQRVLDPACGSGTFLFHAIRRLRAAGVVAGWDAGRIVSACVAQVRGMDVHPVAVIIARVTWLLALGPDIQQRQGDLHVPVFLGDAMQWNVDSNMDRARVSVEVPGEAALQIPAGFTESQELLDAGVQTLKDGLDRGTAPAVIERTLARLPGVDPADAAAMRVTYERLMALFAAGRDGIWPYVLRNLVRPLWLSRPEQRADVLLGNPPWVAFRHLAAPMQRRLREASQALDLWVGGHLATQQDLCALFTVRSVHLYLKTGGGIALVLPYAVLNRPAFAGLRRGDCRLVSIQWDAAWSLDETVQPLFPVPACVMFGRRRLSGPLPTHVARFSGSLIRRDASEAEADLTLRHAIATWPPIPRLAGQSAYRARCINGANLFPRRFWLVSRVTGGRLGQSPSAPLVEGRVGSQDKRPWRNLAPPRGPVEQAFLRPLVLGESLAPFRLLSTSLTVVAVNDRGQILDSGGAERTGFPKLAGWLQQCERLWGEHAARSEAGRIKMSLMHSIDHMKKLSRQFPIEKTRVVYSASGSLFAAVIIEDSISIIEQACYYINAYSIKEARYLVSILNCDWLREQIEAMQPKGQGGARHFDNLMWELPIPEYDGRLATHLALAALAEECEALAAGVPLTEGVYFTTQRRVIRDALEEAGLMRRLDDAVRTLLGR